jgi:hypothetical protein
MRTRLRRTCQAVVFVMCNSRLPFRTDSLGLRLKVASTCHTASNSHGDDHRFSSYKCIPGFQSCQTTIVTMLEEVDAYETVFCRPIEHWCINLFSYTVTRKLFSMGDANGGKYPKYRNVPLILTSLRI